MLIKVPKHHVRPGMFIQSIEGSWLEHPFWRTRFVLRDPADVEALRSSDIWGIVIDDEQGDPYRPGPETSAPEQEGACAAPAPAEPDIAVVERRRTSGPRPPAVERRRSPEQQLPTQFERAAAIIGRGRIPVTKLLNQARLGGALDARSVMPLVEDIAASVESNASALISITRIREKDEYTYMHSIAVCALMINLARKMGFDEPLVRELGLGGLLHDIGKVAVPAHLLARRGKLSAQEFEMVKAHTLRGHEMLSRSPGISEVVLEICVQHHEKIDGTGYPHGLKGDQIGRYARMAAICDVYDAVTSNRPYKEAWDPADSLAAMFNWEGHFDPEIMTAFIRSVGIYPVGSLVRLASDRLAVVAAQGHDLTKPVVRVFFSIATRAKLPVVDIDLARSGGADQIVSREEPKKWGFLRWDDQWPQLIRLDGRAAAA